MPASHQPDEPGAQAKARGAPAPAPGIPGAETLQAAALQMIAAARAFLDVAEQAVHDPQVVSQVASVVGTVAKGVVASLGALASTAGSAASSGKDDDPPLEHITVD